MVSVETWPMRIKQTVKQTQALMWLSHPINGDKDKTSAVKHSDKNCYHDNNTAYPCVASSCHIQAHVY